MRHTDISVGDTLRLKPNNGYGFGPREVQVVAIEPRNGYAVPWIRGKYRWTNPHNGHDNLDFGSFKPSDFACRV